MKTFEKIIFVLFGVDLSGSVKRLKCEYDKPGNISQLADYYTNFLNGMLADPLFTGIAVLLDSAVTQVGKLRTAQQATIGGDKGKTDIRNTEYLNTEVIMDDVLNQVQKAGDADMSNAKTIFDNHNLKIREHGKHERDLLEVKNGKVSGTFDVKDRKAGNKNSYAAYAWLISDDKVLWQLGDFSRSTTDTISKMGDTPLVIGKLYYIKTKSDSSDGKSDWSPIIEKYCL